MRAYTLGVSLCPTEPSRLRGCGRGAAKFAALAVLVLLASPSAAANEPVNLFSDAEVPLTADSGPDAPVEVGVRFRADRRGNVLGILFYNGVKSTGTHVGTLWSEQGRLARGTFTGETAAGWQRLRFDQPVAIEANTEYVASYHTPHGHYAVSNPYPWPRTSGPLTGEAGVFCYAAQPCRPTKGFGTSNYWLDVLFQPTEGPPPPSPPPGEWVLCAPLESSDCPFAGMKEVRYGVEGSYVSRWVTGGVLCDNDSFGVDPAPDQVKHCDMRDLGPDRDRDAVRDSRDQCLDEPGPDSHNGCPGQALPPGDMWLGVFAQQPRFAAEYRAIGINHYVGLPGWPDENNRVWTLQAMQELRAAGMKVAPSYSRPGVRWINHHLEFADTVVMWSLGDEFDMVHNATPSEHVNQLAADAERADPSRGQYVNFGLSYCAWPFRNTGTWEPQLNQYTQGLEAVSCDYYALTDPSPPQRGMNAIWAYGFGVDQMERYARGKPVYGFVDGAKLRAEKMPPEKIAPIVWNIIAHGADGINYFCHDFSTGAFVSDVSCLEEAENRDAIAAVNADVQSYADVLKSLEVGASSPFTGLVPVTVRAHRANGAIYVIAAADGTSEVPEGAAQDATIVVPGGGDATVTALDEGRTVQMRDGRFVDHFDPYEHHVYRVIPDEERRLGKATAVRRAMR